MTDLKCLRHDEITLEPNNLWEFKWATDLIFFKLKNKLCKECHTREYKLKLVSILISQYIKLTIIVQNFWSLWWTNASKLYAVIWLKGPNKIQLFYPIPTQELSANWGRGAFLFLDWRPVSHRGVFRLIAGRVHGGDLVERTTILIQILIKIELVSKYQM